MVCGRTQRAQDDSLAVVNPVLLVEITSTSTEDYDRGEKLRQYTLLPSVRDILIVSHREPRLTLHRCHGRDWQVVDARHGDTVRLESIACEISVDEVYRDGLEDVD